MNNYEMMNSRESLVEFQVLGAIVVQPWPHRPHHKRRLWCRSKAKKQILNELSFKSVEAFQKHIEEQQELISLLKHEVGLKTVTSNPALQMADDDVHADQVLYWVAIVQNICSSAWKV